MQEGPQPAHLTWFNIGIGLLFLVLDALLSVTLQLGLATSLVTAAVRCVVQLTVMVCYNVIFFIKVGV
jgi:ABC-type iron transport system FetAB permease component